MSVCVTSDRYYDCFIQVILDAIEIVDVSYTTIKGPKHFEIYWNFAWKRPPKFIKIKILNDKWLEYLIFYIEAKNLTKHIIYVSGQK